MLRGAVRAAARGSMYLSVGGMTAFAASKYRSGELTLPPTTPPPADGGVNVPGANSTATSMLPARALVFAGAFTATYPLLLVGSYARALYLRATLGMPSDILKTGTYAGWSFGEKHLADQHYVCQMLYSKPFDEAKLRRALVSLCAEDGIQESEVELVFKAEVPQDWPKDANGQRTGSFAVHHFVPGSIQAGSHVPDYFDAVAGKPKGLKVRLHVFNGKPGKPTVVLYAGSINGWDGSANYNFNKELQSR